MNVTTRVPIGPVGIITPWNTPFMLSTWKIAPALAAGCTVVHKPAELSPLTARLLLDIAMEAGMPKGVWNLVNGMGEDAGRALTEHPAIKAIAFVGESRTGSMIAKQGADTLKRTHFELGGKNPVIVFDDANKIRVGHPLDPTTEVGPLIGDEHFTKVTSYFDIAKEDGATVAAGGKRQQRYAYIARGNIWTGIDVNTIRN